MLKVLGNRKVEAMTGSGTRLALDVALSGSKRLPAGNETRASVRRDVSIAHELHMYKPPSFLLLAIVKQIIMFSISDTLNS